MGSKAIRDGVMTMPLSDPRWTSFVESHPLATPVHHPAWAELLARAYRFQAAGLALVDERGEIEAALPIIRLGRGSRRRAVSLPFTDWCGPLLGPEFDSSRLGERLEVARRASRLSSLEVRESVVGDTAYSAVQGYRHVLALQPDQEEALFAGFASRTRNKLRRSEREGVSVQRSSSERDLLGTFYPMHVATRRRLGVPVQPRRFFELLASDYLSRGLGFVVTASVDGDPVSTAVFLAWNGRMNYRFSASNRGPTDVGTGQAVIWDALRWGCANGQVEFDFGRTELGHEGLRMFKSAWGGDERDLTYTVLADRPPRPRGGRALRMLEPVIQKSPEIVTRAIGRAGYRYTA